MELWLIANTKCDPSQPHPYYDCYTSRPHFSVSVLTSHPLAGLVKTLGIALFLCSRTVYKGIYQIIIFGSPLVHCSILHGAVPVTSYSDLQLSTVWTTFCPLLHIYYPHPSHMHAFKPVA